MKRIALVLSLALIAVSFHASDDVRATVEAFAKIGSAMWPSFSPDGERVAFLPTISGSPQVWTMPVAGGFPEPVYLGE